MKKNTWTIVVTVLAIVLLILTILQFYKSKKNQKEISRLESNINNLEEELKDAKDKIEEYEDQLSEVEHFENGSISHGYSSGGTNFTGTIIETRIDGDFEGWDGETIFKMMNGTIWQQASYDYEYHYAYMPEVIIYRKNSGYYMRVDGVNDEIRVEQIR